jgi:RNA polymerase sigma factor (sigma-70 family)
MDLDSREPGFALSRVDVDADLVRKAQAYLECRSHGRIPSDELTHGWSKFYRTCDLAIRRFAVRCGAPSVADCSQEVWKTLVMSLAKFESQLERPRFCSWLYRLVRNKAVDQLRERTRHPTKSLEDSPEELFSSSDWDHEWERRSLRSRVHQVLGELAQQIPECSYRIFYLHYIEGVPMPEIARLLNLRIQEVYTRHHRAKQKFRCLFELHGDRGFPPV